MRFGDAFITRPLTGFTNLGGKKDPVPKVCNSTTLGAPTGGINARDSFADMDPTDAISLVNFFPSVLGCQVRNGYMIYGRGYPGPVETLGDHMFTDGSEHLYAFSAGYMWNATSGGPAGPNQMLGGLSNNRWQWVNYPTTGGCYWIAVNGADNPIVVDPSGVVHRLVAGNGTDPYTISGTNPAYFMGVIIHQKRLWFSTGNATVCCYLPPGQMWGVLGFFDYGPLWTKGGYVMCQFTWTVDAGDGPNDNLCTMSNTGEVTVYTGTDPSTTATWQLAGVFFIGRPVGRRCAVKYGGDVAILCAQGIASLNSVLTSTTVNSRTTFFTDKILSLINTEVQLYAGVFGWQPIVYPMKNMLLLNVPDGNQPNGYQLVMNTITGAWTSYIGYKAACWTNYQGVPYFGGTDGTICQAMYGFTDGADPTQNLPGTDINCQALTAFNYFTMPGAQKNFTMVRPNIIGLNQPAVSVIVNTEFDTTLAPAPQPAKNIGVPVWDVADWDQALWSVGSRTFKDWYNVRGLGYAGSLSMQINVKDQASWASTDWIFQIQKGTAL